MKKASRLLVFFCLLAFVGCAHMRSGHYVQIQSKNDLKKIADRYGVSPAEILNANRGRDFRPGSWYLIPLNRGLVQLFQHKALYPNISHSPEFLQSGKFLWPVPDHTQVSSSFGERWGRPHHGVDIPGDVGSDVIAAEDGVVVHTGTMGGYGNILVVKHAGGYFSVYAHLNQHVANRGQRVSRGQVVAKLGNTGRSTGPHLHFEMRKNSKPLNPMAYIKKSRQFLASR